MNYIIVLVTCKCKYLLFNNKSLIYHSSKNFCNFFEISNNNKNEIYHFKNGGFMI